MAPEWALGGGDGADGVAEGGSGRLSSWPTASGADAPAKTSHRAAKTRQLARPRRAATDTSWNRTVRQRASLPCRVRCAMVGPFCALCSSEGVAASVHTFIRPASFPDPASNRVDSYSPSLVSFKARRAARCNCRVVCIGCNGVKTCAGSSNFNGTDSVTMGGYATIGYQVHTDKGFVRISFLFNPLQPTMYDSELANHCFSIGCELSV